MSTSRLERARPTPRRLEEDHHHEAFDDRGVESRVSARSGDPRQRADAIGRHRDRHRFLSGLAARRDGHARQPGPRRRRANRDDRTGWHVPLLGSAARRVQRERAAFRFSNRQPDRDASLVRHDPYGGLRPLGGQSDRAHGRRRPGARGRRDDRTVHLQD